MRILVDARLSRGGGIGRYLREITGPWLRAPDVEAVAFLGRPEELGPWLAQADPRGIGEVVPWSDGPYSPLAQLRWLRVRRRAGWGTSARSGASGRLPFDVTFFPHYDVPLLAHPGPSVVTVHDLTQFRFPDGFPAWKRRAGRLLLEGALDRAAAVITISESTRRDLLDLAPGLAPRLTVVPNGVSTVFRPLAPAEGREAARRWAHLHPFVLVLGPPKAHKNLALAVEAVERVREGGEGTPLTLVAAGISEADPAFHLKRARDPGAWIQGLPAPDDDTLRELYALAAALLFPSRYEGFGLPPLEALASGGRVLASDIPPLRETLGAVDPGRARLLPPDDPEAWAEALGAMLRRREEEAAGAAGAPPEATPSPLAPGEAAASAPAPTEAAPPSRPPDEGAAAPPSFPSWEEASARTLEVLREVGRGG